MERTDGAVEKEGVKADRRDEVKKALAEQIAKDVAEGLKVDLGDVSVAFEEVFVTM